MPVMTTEYQTVQEVATELGVSEDTILREIWLERLTAYKIGGTWRIKPEDKGKYLEARRNKKKQNKRSSS